MNKGVKLFPKNESEVDISSSPSKSSFKFSEPIYVERAALSDPIPLMVKANPMDKHDDSFKAQMQSEWSCWSCLTQNEHSATQCVDCGVTKISAASISALIASKKDSYNFELESPDGPGIDLSKPCPICEPKNDPKKLKCTCVDLTERWSVGNPFNND